LLSLGGGTVKAQEVRYDYDDANRLRTVTHADGSALQYTLDAGGNRTEVRATRGAGRIHFTSSTAAVSESGGSLNFEVNRTLSSYGTASVSYTTTDGTATAGSDYTARSGTFTWNDGDASPRTISVPITSDNVFEGNETFTVTLSGVSAGAVLGSAQVATTINDDDVVRFSISNLSVNEGGGNAVVSVTKVGASAFTHNVSYSSSNGTATSNSDYTAVSGTLTFSASQDTQSFNVSLINDAAYEGNETFSLTLFAPTGGAQLGTASAVVTIIDSIAPPNFWIYSNDVYENGGAVTLNVTKAGPTALTHTVNFATSNESAVAGADYVGTSGVLTFAPAETSKSITVQILDDTSYEGMESFLVTLSNPSGGAILSAANPATVRIIENEPVPSGGSVRFTTVSVGLAENVGSVALSVRRSSGSYGAASVVCQTSNGTAIAGVDYTAVSTTLTWANGDTADKTCTIPILDDATYENTESFQVNLSAPSGVSLGEWTRVDVVISDNDPTPPAGVLQFTSPGYSVVENQGSIAIPVTRTGGSFGAASVVCSTISAGATAGSDFGATTVTLNWANGDANTKYCTVPIFDDSIRETDCSIGWCFDEWFDITLSSPSGASLGDTIYTSVTIVENE
jgi:YD repeat-containing protein